MPQDEFSAPQAHATNADDDIPPFEVQDPPERGGLDFTAVERRFRVAVVAYPLLALGAAVAGGYLLGRLFRR